MERSRTVLVGIDGSPSSMHALDWAAAFAEQTGWALHLVCSYSMPTFTAASLDGYAAYDDFAVQDGAKAILLDAMNRIRGRGLGVTAAAATGDPAGVLVEMSKDYGLAVVGTRGRGGFTERLLGTVSAAMPAHASCPVVVVPWRGHGKKHAELHRPVSDWVPIRRIVVGMDGSGSANAAMRLAIELAQAWDAELVAVAGVPVGSGQGMMSWLPQQVDHEQVLADVRAGLDANIAKLEREYPGVKIRRVVLDGTGAELLCEFSTAADLLVVGSRGRGGFRGLVLGSSTSQAVLHQSACPVLVIPRKAAG